LLLQVAEFDDVPILIARQLEAPGGRVYAREGDLLIRSRTCETRRISSADELRELLGRAVARRGASLLADMYAIITGVSPASAPGAPTPEERFAADLPDWPMALEQWLAERQNEEHPRAWWEVRLLPTSLAAPLPAAQRVKVIDAPAVSWRGWNYPTRGVRTEDFSYLQRYARFAYEDGQFSERWQAAYATGTFASAHMVHSDLIPSGPDFRHPDPPQRLIDVIDLCWSLTEFFRFAASYTEGLATEGVWLSAALHRVLRRPLGMFDSRYWFWHSGKSAMDDIVQSGNFGRAELAAGWRDVALDWTIQILTVFQWPEVNRETLARHQTRLIERRW
ncbi:MAG TPA: hypothetical protein VGP82_08530, partial [Ktedonobacterales bacterium]|nr:hypothetical protein [Ktedonobacterales bacterium]